jgi:hypothetical protein
VPTSQPPSTQAIDSREDSGYRSSTQDIEIVPSLLGDEPILSGFERSSTTTAQYAWPATTLPATVRGPPLDISQSSLIGLYYRKFHGLHPCALPQRYLQSLWNNAAYQTELEPLIAVMQFIGSLYGPSEQSPALKDAVGSAISDTSVTSPSPFLVQTHLLYAVTLYWCNERPESRRELDSAIRMAVDLGMFRQEYATENSHGDPVLAESWRRTWWQIYIVDAYIAAIQRTPNFATRDIEVDVELPCEEDEYASEVSGPSKRIHLT